ncbi:hypothetical protein J6590_045899, partial [Homalodisca vitripennis]
DFSPPGSLSASINTVYIWRCVREAPTYAKLCREWRQYHTSTLDLLYRRQVFTVETINRSESWTAKSRMSFSLLD